MLGYRTESWEKLAVAAHYDARELAKLCAMSTRQLQRYFNRDLNQSPQNWLNERRIEAARRLFLGELNEAVERGAGDAEGDAGKSPTESRHAIVMEDDRKHRNGSQAVDIGAIDARTIRLSVERCRYS